MSQDTFNTTERQNAVEVTASVPQCKKIKRSGLLIWLTQLANVSLARVPVRLDAEL